MKSPLFRCSILTLSRPMGYSIKFDTVHYILCYNFQKTTLFISLKIDFVSANSADPDEMLHYAAFHLGRHCLRKYPLRGTLVRKLVKSLLNFGKPIISFL